MIDLIAPTYLPNISYMAWLIRKKKIYFDLTDKYNKQTYRNRSEIYGSNGKLILTIPIIHVKEKKYQLTKEVKIYNDKNWQSNHWKSICSAYRSSPYFEFYEEEFFSHYFKIKEKYLFNFNLKLISKIYKLLNQPLNFKNESFNKKNHNKIYQLIDAKNKYFETPKYNQVFSSKYGFLSNLSILDLLFNLGPNAIDYLYSINIKL
tara:strand:- start:1917 stop:2531 length:615 start_codon:yes stop_codon:yes gene_type:complete